jgi:ABC-type Fe3+-hydroxamate transport system substrate-binding protein
MQAWKVLGWVLVVVAVLVGACGRGKPPAGAAPKPLAPVAATPRIVSLSPAVGIMLRDLDLAKYAVGRDRDDMVLPKTLPVCGDQSEPDYEALLRAHPTHILMQWGARELPGRLVSMAKEHGWDVRNYALLSLDDIQKAAMDIQEEIGGGYSARSAYAAGFKGNIDPGPLPPVFARMEAWLPHPGALAAAGRILLLGSVDPPGAVGPGSFHHQILERIGGTPALTTGGAWVTMDAEDVLRLKPDGIIVLSPRPVGAPAAHPSVDELKAKLGRVGTLDIPAVRNGWIALIDDPLCLTPSTAMIDVAEEMKGILEGWAKK